VKTKKLKKSVKTQTTKTMQLSSNNRHGATLRIQLIYVSGNVTPNNVYTNHSFKSLAQSIIIL